MIYVLVPAHNEAATVGLLLWKVRQLFTSFNREYQLIVVNDGSTDATDEVLAPYTRALPLTLISHRIRQGYARSLEALLREAVKRTDRPKRDLAITLQADFSESPDDTLELIKRLEGGADVVVADRRNRVGASRMESFARRALTTMARRRLGLTGADDLVGTMRGYRVAAIQRLVREHGDQPFLGHHGWAADLELLARVARHARTIESIPVAGARAEAARPSRLRPLAEAWRAWRAAVGLQGLPRPQLADGALPVEQAERAEAVARPSARREDHAESGGRGGRHERHAQGERRGPRPDHRNEGRGKKRGSGQPGPRPDKAVAAPRPPAPSAPVAEAAANTTPATSSPDVEGAAPGAPQGEGGPKRRRRRGRGRGRGRGPGPRPQGQSVPAPPAPPPSAA